MPLSNSEFLAALSTEVTAGNVRRIPHKTLPLSIYNYTETCQFGKLWNEINSMCRGLVVDDSGEIIARPFKKFFNFEELGDKKSDFAPSNIKEIWSKEDGSLIVCFYYDDEWVCITRGAWESPQAKAAPALLTPQFLDFSGHSFFKATYCFELTGPANYNVTRGYKKDSLILLGIIDTATGNEADSSMLATQAAQLGFSIPKSWGWMNDEFYAHIKAITDPNFEGVVLINGSGERCKIKTETYVLLHKTLTGITPSRIFELWEAKRHNGLELMIDGVPDEFFEEINYGIAECEKRWIAYHAKTRLEWYAVMGMVASGVSRKDIAIGYPGLRHVLTVAFSKTDPESVAFVEFCKAKGDI